MSAAANWSYTAIATLWRKLGSNDDGEIWSEPIKIWCDYGGDASGRLGDVGLEIVIKNTFWTEYAEARQGDYILIGESSVVNPLEANADEVRHVIRYADTFDRIADDFAIITGV